jgi:hypothetical protein
MEVTQAHYVNKGVIVGNREFTWWGRGHSEKVIFKDAKDKKG